MSFFKRNRKVILVTSFFLLCVIAAVAILVLSAPTRSAPAINISGADGVSVYVSGKDVYLDESGNYAAPAGATVTLTAVNERRMFVSYTLTGTGMEETVVSSPIHTLTVPSDGILNIQLSTSSAALADNRGKYFANPYLLETAEDVVALARVLEGVATAEQYQHFGFDTLDAAQQGLKSAYFRLATSVLITEDDFYGIGIGSDRLGGAGVPFSGCFDFDGNHVTLYVQNSFAPFEAPGGTVSVGFFGRVEGDGVTPCLLRGVDVRGSMSFREESDFDDWPSVLHFGGMAGMVTGSVLIDGATSSLSLSANAPVAIDLGGVIGRCESPIEVWSDITYSGDFSNLSATSSGYNKYLYLGGVLGVFADNYCNGLANTSNGAVVSATVSGDDAGNANAAGVIGRIEAINRDVSIHHVRMDTKDDISLSALIHDSVGGVDDDRAVAAGVYGMIYSSNDHKVTLGHVTVTSEEDGELIVWAGTQTASSKGITYAAGLIGYANHHEDVTYIPGSDSVTFFDIDVSISSVQNGYGPAYAGGLFGHDTPVLSGDYHYTMNLNSPGHRIDVQAMQASTAVKEGDNLYPVAAGFLTSVLEKDFSISDFTFVVQKGTATAKREVGSTAIGDLYAGGFAGLAEGTAGGTASFHNVVLRLYDSSVHALSLSYDSNYGQGANYRGNNAYAGGFVGLLDTYGSATVNQSTNSISGIAGVDGITVYFEEHTQEHAVRTMQNAVSGGSDYATEGYAGGVFGMVKDSYVKNLHAESIGTRAMVHIHCTNSPDTSMAGGVIGATRAKDAPYAVDGVVARKMLVVAMGYYDGDNAENKCDLYAGGAIGVLGCGDRDVNVLAKNIHVYNTSVEAVGEEDMLTYAGGIVGGIWWMSHSKLVSSSMVNGNVLASSVAYEAYAAGIAGLVQHADVESCYVLNTVVEARVENNSRYAYAAGVTACLRNNASLKGNVIASTLGVDDRTRIAALSVHREGSVNNVTGNYYVPSYAFLNYASLKPIPESISREGTVLNNSCSGYLTLTGSVSRNSNTLSNAVALTNGQSASVFPQKSSAMAVRFSGDTAAFSVNGTTVRANNNQNGNMFATLWVNIFGSTDASGIDSADPAAAGWYPACTYPVVANSGSTATSGIHLTDSDSGAPVTADNTAGYYVHTVNGMTYHHLLVNVGQVSLLQNLTVTFDNPVALSLARMYDVTVPDSLAELGDQSSSWISKADGATYQAHIETLVGAKGSAINYSRFNGRLKVGSDNVGAAITVTPLQYIDRRTVLLLECGNNGVIVEVVPNYIDHIEIAPSEDTPPLGISSEGEYVYVPGDTVRFEMVETHRFPYSIYMSQVTYSGTGVSPNGTVLIPANADNGDTVDVTCTLFSDSSINVTVKIVVSHSIDFSSELSGTSLSSDRKAAVDLPFDFTVSPLIGYGEMPERLEIMIGDKVYSLSGMTFATSDASANAVVTVNGTPYSDYPFAYTFIADEGSYTVTVPAELLTADVGSIKITAEFPIVYYMVFDRGIENDRYFVDAVKTDTVLDSAYYERVRDRIEGVERFGLTLTGYYMTSEASTLSAYGTSFYDYCESGSLSVNGSISFYARWIYDVLVEAPDGITVRSCFASGFLQPDGTDAPDLIPIDTFQGFSFIPEPDAAWGGVPSFDLFICNRDGEGGYSFTNVTDKLTYDGGFYLAQEEITGFLYLKVYSDNVAFYVGGDGYSADAPIIYEDGVFTAQYFVNYGAAGQELAQCAVSGHQGKGVEFRFGGYSLPAGTSLRLYRSFNGVAHDAAVLILESAANSVYSADFTDMRTGQKLSLPTGYSSLYAEGYSLVVTLPNHIAELDRETEVTLSVHAEYHKDLNTLTYGEWSQELLDLDATLSGAEHSETVYTVCPSVTLSYAVSDSGAFAFVRGDELEGVKDRRHENVQYVWRITKTDKGAIGDVAFFAVNPVCRTFDAVYYHADGTNGLIANGLSGYTVSLIETTNVQSPAAGIVLATYIIP
ncbi:MAG: hypothetical protein E7663_01290 [Ruminococcaceae bacterium]|nr:hypothetical protein [Oscillospiraceae bacterium]